MKDKTEYYLIRIFGDVDPVIVGEYKSNKERDKAARKIREEDDQDLHDGLYRLDIVNGKPVIDSFSGYELEDCSKED
jgi:hypothetical protein